MSKHIISETYLLPKY